MSPRYESTSLGVWTTVGLWYNLDGGPDGYPGQTAGLDTATIQHAITAPYASAFHLAGFTVTPTGTFTNTGTGTRTLTLTCDTGSIVINGNLGGSTGPRNINLVASVGAVTIGYSANVTMYGSVTSAGPVTITPGASYTAAITGNISCAGDYFQAGGTVTGTVTLSAASSEHTIFASGAVTGTNGILISGLAVYALTGDATPLITLSSGVLHTGDGAGHNYNASSVVNTGGTVNVSQGSTVTTITNSSTLIVGGTVTTLATGSGSAATISGTVTTYTVGGTGQSVSTLFSGTPTIGNLTSVASTANTVDFGTAALTVTGTADFAHCTCSNTSGKLLGTGTVKNLVNGSATYIRAWDGPSIDGGGNVGVDFTAPAPAGPPVGTRGMMGAGR